MKSRVRSREYERINQMLDAALGGYFEESDYDESELSKLESKWVRYLSSAKMSAGKVEEERAKIESLVTDISHQTRTPLANILLYGELLKERELDGECSGMVEQILCHAEKLEFLIQSLVKLSRLESGTFQILPAACSLSELAEAVKNAGQERAMEKNVRISLWGGSGCVDQVWCDRKWTQEALGNILDNAVKYSHAGTLVTMRLFSYEMFSCVEIEDEGVGISEEEIPRIFARFYRGKNVRDDEGVGVGLFLSRRIVETQGGYIKVLSRVGSGSRFQVFLPKAYKTVSRG
ncbi:MAG: HAMP domain-containing histidine kinase [Muribaculaceae bacterium]|nr:HAMP domain-containing histidine kinase [Roseburia sp.]MCM1429803.1 HAMP domain-containing histidine kinase [Muribaculaceae bacterium]MCM1492854.1 HAMP domain-containing histidine kinase [Muribaculaceae bacterium]